MVKDARNPRFCPTCGKPGTLPPPPEAIMYDAQHDEYFFVIHVRGRVHVVRFPMRALIELQAVDQNCDVIILGTRSRHD